jgi:hypothetical protein
MIEPQLFVENMATRLVTFDAKNVATPSLQKAWTQIVEVMNEQV